MRPKMRPLRLIVGLFVWACVVPMAASTAQDATPPGFEKARDALRAAMKKGTADQRKAAVAALESTKDARALDEFLATLRTSESKVESLRGSVETAGKELREIYKVMDAQGSKGRGVSQGTFDLAQVKAKEVAERLSKLDKELVDAEAWTFLLRAGAGGVLGALPQSERAKEVLKLGEAVGSAKKPEERLLFVRVLTASETPEARDALAEALARSNDIATRVAAADGLRILGDDAAAPALARALADESWVVRAAAAQALGSLPSYAGAPALIEALATSEGRATDEIVAALENLAGATWHDSAPLWKDWWAKEGEALGKLTADVASDDASTRRAAYETAASKGALAAAARLLRGAGLNPERDAAMKTSTRGPAAPLAADAAKAAEEEIVLRRTALARTLAERPKQIRERAVVRLLTAPAAACREAGAFDLAKSYVALMGGVREAAVRAELNLAKAAEGGAARDLRQAAVDSLKLLDDAAKDPTPIARGPQEETQGGKATTTFYGIATRSKRILYILDVSGSMGFLQHPEADRERMKIGGKFPIDVAKDELWNSVRSLPEDATFNVILFAHDLRVWKDKQVRADKAGKADLKKFVDGIEAVGATNIFDPLERGFQLAGRGTHDKAYGVVIDTIFFMSDGQANRGRLIQTAQILAEVIRMNALQKLKIHTIGIGKDHDVPLMRALAAQTGGTYVDKI